MWGNSETIIMWDNAIIMWGNSDNIFWIYHSYLMVRYGYTIYILYIYCAGPTQHSSAVYGALRFLQCCPEAQA